MKCLRIYATPDGESHFGDTDIPTTTMPLFPNEAPFTHAFRRWTGMTPSQIRTHGNLRPVERIVKSRRRSSDM